VSERVIWFIEIRTESRSDNHPTMGARRARQHRVSGERQRATCLRGRARPYHLGSERHGGSDRRRIGGESM